MAYNKIFILVILLFLIPIVSSACQTFNVSNYTYDLSANETINGATCFNVTVANVTIDCHGFGIVGNYTANTFAVYTNQFNTSIKNCVIRGFDVGIFFNTSKNGTIENNNINVTVNNYAEPAYAAGIMLYNVSGNNTISNNTVYSRYGPSLFLYLSCNYNNITGSTFTSDAVGGLWNSQCSFNTISNSQISGPDDTYGSLSIYANSKTNLIVNNTINGREGAYAIALKTQANSGNIFVNNTLKNATTLLYIDTTSGNNTFYWNNFTDTIGVYVNDTNGTNYYNTTISTQPAGNIWYNIIDESVTITGNVESPFSGLYYGSAGSDYPYTNITSFGKFLCNFTDCADYAPLTSAISCLNLDTANTIYSLKDNVSTNGSTCFNVTAANVTLDCAGYSILGNGTNSTYGIYSNQFNTTINNCTVRDFHAGIFFDGATNGTITHSTARTNNTYVPSPHYASGIVLGSNANYNFLNNNTAYSGYGTGMRITGNFNGIHNTTATTAQTCSYDYAVYVTGSNNTFNYLNATSLGSSCIGMVLDTTINNTINNSNLSSGDSNAGLSLYNTNKSLIINSKTYSPTGTALVIGSVLSGNNCHNDTFIDVNITGGYHAIDAENSANITISNSTISGAGFTASVIVLTNMSLNTFYNNTIICAYSGGSDATLLSLLEMSGQNTFYWNNFTNAKGLYVADSNGTNYYNTTISTQPAGNIWYNVINTTVNINGNVSSPFSGLYYGSAGSDYPYTNITSQDKFSCNFSTCADYAPITSLNGSDILLPIITLPFYSNGTSYSNSQNLIFNISVSDSSPSHCFVNVAGNANQTVAVSSGWCNGTYALTGISDGNATINVYANDTLGNLALNDSYVVTIDSTAPIVTLPFYSNGTLKRNIDTLTLNISVSDGTASACKVDINGTNQTYSVSSGWCNITDGFLTGLSDGNATIKVYANDSLNNWGENKSYVVKIDTTAPTFTAISNQTVLVNMSFIYDINATDAGVGLGNFSVNNTGNFTIDYTTGVVTNATALLENYYLLNVTVNDTLGNMGWILWSVNVTPLLCSNLNLVNNVYVLTENLSTNGSTCFNVTAANVTLDCAGYSILGNGTNSTYGIYSNQFNTTINNCTVRDFHAGIFFDGATNGTITHSTARTNNTYVPSPHYASGIVLGSNANYNFLDNNTAYSGYGDGMRVAGNFNGIHNTTATTGSTSSFEYGTYVTGSNNTFNYFNVSSLSSSGIGMVINTVINNTINNSNITGGSANTALTISKMNRSSIINSKVYTQSTALSMSTNSNNNTFINTNITGGYRAVDISNSTNITISNNTINGGGASVSVILLTNTNSNMFSNNTITALGSGTPTLVNIVNLSGFNTFYWNNFTNTAGLYVSDVNGTNYYNTTIASQPAGNSWYNVLNGTVNVTGSVESPFSELYYGSGGGSEYYPYNITTSLEKFSCNFSTCADYAPLTSSYGETADTTGPTITLPFYSNGTIKKNMETLTLNISISDANGTSACNIDINGTNTTVTADSDWCNVTNIPLTNLAEGNATINVYANDSLDNWGENKSYVVFIDSVVPTITLPFYSNGTLYTSSQSLIFNISINGTGTEAFACSLNVAGNTNQTVAVSSGWCNGTYALTGLSDGNATINAYANDTAGNLALNNSFVVNIDSTAPTITLPSYENGTLKVNTDTLTLNISIIDTGGTSACKVDINGTNQTYSVSSGWCNITDGFLTGLSDGNATINVYANDSLNNWGENKSYVVKIDTTAPTFTAIENQTAAVNTSFIYDINATDAGVGLGNFSVNNTGNFTIDYTTGVVTNATALLENYYLLNVTVNDTLGNMDWILWSVNVTSDSTNPNVTINAPSGTVTSSNVTINISFADDTVLDSCSYNVTDSVGVSVVADNSITCGVNSLEYQTISDGSNYVLTAFANDTTGNSNITNSTFSVSTSTTTPSGGGGSSVDRTKYSISKIDAGDSHIVNVLNNDVSIEKITIEVVNNVKGITVTVKDIDNIQNVVSEPASGLVYDYLNISAANLSNSDIKIVNVEFTVPKSWLSQYDKDADSIVLKRYNNMWQNEITTITDESDTKYTFESNIFGFSAFAIVSEEIEQHVAEPAEDETEQPVEEPEQEEPKQPNYYYFEYNLKGILPVVMCIIIALLIVVGYIFFRIEKRKQMY